MVPLIEFKGTLTNDSAGLRNIFVFIKLAIRSLSQDCHETQHTSGFGPRTLYMTEPVSLDEGQESFCLSTWHHDEEGVGDSCLRQIPPKKNSGAERLHEEVKDTKKTGSSRFTSVSVSTDGQERLLMGGPLALAFELRLLDTFASPRTCLGDT